MNKEVKKDNMHNYFLLIKAEIRIAMLTTIISISSVVIAAASLIISYS